MLKKIPKILSPELLKVLSEMGHGAYERFEFYDRAKECYCILQSGESAIYANIILQKGLVL